MEDSMNTSIHMDTNERQRQYVKEQKAKGEGVGVVFADAFLRGMRDIGYKSPAWALAEMNDNAIQASATMIDIRFGFKKDNKNRTKPDEIAIIDNGAGMIPEMISYAVRWGGTDREDNRKGFGRYGYGLPSSAISLAKRYTVYSRVNGEKWHAVTVDIEKLASAADDPQKTEELLSSKTATLPSWLLTSENSLGVDQLKSGTIIVLEELDRLRKLAGWVKAATLKAKLLKDLGVIYRHWIPGCQISVDGTNVQPVDPLFLMEYARFFDETSVQAKRVDTRTFEVETSHGTRGVVRIRASVLPPKFQLINPKESVRRGARNNKRFDIMKAYNGLLICREGRQIDCIQPRWTKYQNYDANIKIEVDFDPELDEYFGITTAKQQIVIEDEMWDKLESRGKNGGALRDLVKDLRKEFEGMDRDEEAKKENEGGKDSPRPSEIAMETSEKFKSRVAPPSPIKVEEARKNLKETAYQIAKETGQAEDVVLEQLSDQTEKRRWQVEFDRVEEGPFFLPKRIGEQKRLIINTDHPFYAKLYHPAASDTQAALEVLLFVLAETELEAAGEAERHYKAARQSWSERLRYALDELMSDDSLINKASIVAETMHTTMETATNIH